MYRRRLGSGRPVCFSRSCPRLSRRTVAGTMRTPYMPAASRPGPTTMFRWITLTDLFVCSGIPSTMGFAMTQAPHMGTKNWTRVKGFSLMWVCKSEKESIPLVDRRRWRSWMARKLATRRISSPHKMTGMILVGMNDSVSERLVDISILQQKLAVCTASLHEKMNLTALL